MRLERKSLVIFERGAEWDSGTPRLAGGGDFFKIVGNSENIVMIKHVDHFCFI